MTQTILNETFDDNVLNPAPWTYAYDVSETNGYLFLNQSTTDLRSAATYTFEDPIYNASITFDTFNHDANDRHMAKTQLRLTAEDGTPFQISFAMLKNPYIGGLNGDPANYDLPRIKIQDAVSGTDWYFSSGANTSSFLDNWTTVSISIDSTDGVLFVDVESDGVNDFEIQDDRLIGARLDSLYFDSYGWFTGHYVYIDNLTVTGDLTAEPETPVSAGFTMPVGDRDGLVVTEARQSEDGWLDGWYNASDLGDPHPTVSGANHLGEDWNLDDIDGDGADEDDTGQPVYAVSAGRVVYVGNYYGASGPSLGLGHTVVIEHLLPDGQTVYSLYAHLQEDSITVTKGQIIEEAGVEIGAIGQTGAAQDGPHLHFEVFSVDATGGPNADTPWFIAMNEFAYTTDDIDPDAAFHAITYADGTVTWFDPSEFIQSGIGFDIDDPISVPGQRGGDVISGGSGNDDLNGGRGRDVLFGFDGDDVISGGRGRDSVAGGGGSDYLHGGRGRDTIEGGDGADQIDGARGRDVIEGEAGNDILIGGRGADEFVFDLDSGPVDHDRILDWSPRDGITIIGGPASFEDLAFEQRPEGVVLHLADGSSVLLEGVDAMDLSADQFTLL